ncbi:glycoside hydrolase family 28 protein [Anaerobium acetethylicum]|uniref:Polygalacturonase n=1 Tax=Anaerobium acetethylicum TaxID=1619234 RepID=A0A1D3TX72_9FIRM|nr:glycoside hydrolase family 28 protein [Anaerobium acetethylicum]SCP98896.1 Polygalacturonase [Anaerobium acetethylicum]
MNKTQLRENILRQIEKPHIPNTEYPCSGFGIIADSNEVQTVKLQQAIDTISRNGGGRLILSSGTYRTGALQLKNNVELHLQSKNTILSFVNEEIEKHYPLVLSHWEATPCYNYSPLIYACEAHDIAITGEGILDGGADEEHWWNWHHQVENAWSANKVDLQLHDRKALRKMNMDCVPVKERRFGPGHFLRPSFIQPMKCERVLLSDFTIHHSPMWQVNPVMCKSLTISGLTLSSHGANNDGCDPESCDGVHIVNCRFDTGDDCISLKSGRDRDGRIANIPCKNILIENNEFADGHGGIALGSEMSGGISKVVAVNNYFTSPNLTYALRLKTNARRGGIVEDIILADSVMEHVNGAAVHGTMLYEDGRNGDDLPVFRNILVENITAHGGDYGIFLEAFPEVPMTGLVLRNIKIDGVARTMHGMNWDNPVIEAVKINGEEYPRPTKVRIAGVTQEGEEVSAIAESCGTTEVFSYVWENSKDGVIWKEVAIGPKYLVPERAGLLRVLATNQLGHTSSSHSYKMIGKSGKKGSYKRLICRGMLRAIDEFSDSELITRSRLAKMLLPLVGITAEEAPGVDPMKLSIERGFLAKHTEGESDPQGYVTRQEMATVTMQACGINYKNASSTMPECVDVADVYHNYGTNVARSLYFGFMRLEEDGTFLPRAYVTMGEAVEILNRVADFAGI